MLRPVSQPDPRRDSGSRMTRPMKPRRKKSNTDTHYFITTDDPDRLRFQGRIRSLIDIRSEEDMPAAQWMKLPRS
jgi:hypothetical protein